jgi:hypothetical protein
MAPTTPLTHVPGFAVNLSFYHQNKTPCNFITFEALKHFDLELPFFSGISLEEDIVFFFQPDIPLKNYQIGRKSNELCFISFSAIKSISPVTVYKLNPESLPEYEYLNVDTDKFETLN